MGNDKTHPDLIVPGLSTYLQPGSRNRHARVCWQGRTFTRTTGTSDKELARKRALAFFAECLPKLHQKSTGRTVTAAKPQSRRFDTLADEWLDGKRTTLCEREWRNLRNILTAANGPGSFFGRRDIDEINTALIRRYLRFAEENSTRGKLSPNTLKSHLSVVSGVLKLAAEQQLIPAVPPMPKVRVKDEPRPWFTPDEYKILIRTARRLAAEAQARKSVDA